MLISTSFLSSNNVAKDLKKLNDTNTDFIHVDVMDGKFVENKTMPFSEMKNIYKYTSKRLDVHLMVKNAKKYIMDYATLNTEYMSIHIESDDVSNNLELIKNCGIRCGLAINPNTDVKELVPYLPLIDIVIVMSVEPGKGGQEFITETEEKIKELKELINEYKLNILISVDGGVNNETKELCSDANILVAGNYILSGNDYQERIDSLR